jgi:hypothetical protein
MGMMSRGGSMGDTKVGATISKRDMRPSLLAIPHEHTILTIADGFENPELSAKIGDGAVPRPSATCDGHNILSGVSQSLRARHSLITGDRSAHRAVDSNVLHHGILWRWSRSSSRPITVQLGADYKFSITCTAYLRKIVYKSYV